MLLFFAALAVVILDQAVKLWVVRNIALGSAGRTLIAGVLSLTHVRNEGAAFSLLSGGGGRFILSAVALLFAAAVLFAFRRGYIKTGREKLCYAMIAAGGLSNCIDRIVRGYVVDMFMVELFDFAIFNLADVFITVFCFALIIITFTDVRQERT